MTIQGSALSRKDAKRLTQRVKERQPLG